MFTAAHVEEFEVWNELDVVIKMGMSESRMYDGCLEKCSRQTGSREIYWQRCFRGKVMYRRYAWFGF